MKLHHGTFADCLPAILREGLDDPSYWGTEATSTEYGDGPALIVDCDAFDPDLLMPNDLLIEALRAADPEDAGVLEWEASDRTWQDSLRIFGSIRYDGRLMVDEELHLAACIGGRSMI